MTDAVWVLRHGERQDSVDDGRGAGGRDYDPELTDRGRRQARRVGERLREEGIEEIYASPFLGAVQTAALVADALEGPIRVEPGLGEHLDPEWFDEHPEVLGREELAERFPRVDADYRPLLEPTYPEDRADAEKRIGEAAHRILDSTDAERVLFVGHRATVDGVAHELVDSVEGVDAPVCGLAKFARDGDGDWRVEASGDVTHLDA